MSTTETRPADTPWVRTVRPASAPVRRLLVCPPAGAGSRALSGFVAALPPELEVLALQYPGRGDRRKEEGLLDVLDLAGPAAAELGRWSDDPAGTPNVVVGHSFGAAVAFEVTRLLEVDGHGPACLVVAGRPAPSAGLGLPAPRDDDDIVAELERTGAVSRTVLARPNMRRSILSVLRADFHANATYSTAADTTIDASITVLHSADDPYLDAEGSHRWAGHTTGRFRVATLSGGHDFLDTDPRAAVSELVPDL